MSWTVVMSMGGSSSELSSPREPAHDAKTERHLYSESVHVWMMLRVLTIHKSLTVFPNQAELEGVLIFQRAVQIHRHVRFGLLLQPVQRTWNNRSTHLLLSAYSNYCKVTHHVLEHVTKHDSCMHDIQRMNLTKPVSNIYRSHFSPKPWN